MVGKDIRKDIRTDEDDTIILSIKLRSGRFESSIEVPLFASDEERKVFTERWFDLMDAGLKIGRVSRSQK